MNIIENISKVIIIICVFILTLTGCATRDKIVINPIITTQPIILIKPKPIMLAPIQWHTQVINKSTIFTLTPEEFKKLNDNLLQIEQFIKEQAIIIKYYTQAINDNANIAKDSK